VAFEAVEVAAVDKIHYIKDMNKEKLMLIKSKFL
jgi:hypothetical protein